VNSIQSSMAQQGLVRPMDQRVLGGVCAGLGRRFGLGAWTARVLFLVVLMLVPGSQILVYPLLWLLMPSEDTLGRPAYPPAV
jgi:phage shock protein C